MFTEGEAKRRWCPHAGEQRVQRQDELCIASDCMAWRWAHGKRGDGPISECTPKVWPGINERPEAPAGHDWHAGKEDDGTPKWGLFPKLGYCGLARAP